MADNPKNKPAPIEDMFDSMPIPHWMQPPKQTSNEPFNDHTWFQILEYLSNGESLASICRDRPGMPKDPSRLRRWIFNDPDRKQQYMEAQEVGTEALADEMLTIADGTDSLEDVQRSQLRVNTYKWVVACRNRSRYGEKKQIEQSVTVNIAEAMDRAEQRVIDIKAEVLDDGD